MIGRHRRAGCDGGSRLDREAGGAPVTSARVRPVHVDVPGVGVLAADLGVVTAGGPTVVFAHGSGSSRHSPRNRAVARRLHRAGLGTLLLDLLTPAEEEAARRGGRLRFDVDALARRLAAAVDWLDGQPPLRPERVGYFGASTGAAGALVAAARQGERIAAVVSRGGRPDLADAAAPTGHGADVADRRWPGPAGAGAQRARVRAAALCEAAGGGAGRDAPVRRARHPRAGRRGSPPAGSAGACGEGDAARPAGAAQPRRCVSYMRTATTTPGGGGEGGDDPDRR